MEAVAAAIASYPEKGVRMKEISYQGERYLLASDYSEFLNQSVYQLIPMNEIYTMQNRFYFLLGGYLIFSTILIFLYPCSVKRILNGPIYWLIEAFKELEKGELKTRITYRAADEFNYLYDAFNHMVKRLKQLIDENYKSGSMPRRPS